MVRKSKAKYDWRQQVNKIGAVDAIKNLTAKNSRNNVFPSKHTTNKVLPNVFRGFEVRGKIRYMF